MAGKLRLFWAVNLPGELKAKIGQMQERLKAAGAGAKWVDHHNLHVTIKFLGDTDTGQVAQIVDTAASSLKNFKAFRLEVGGLGFFPGPASPRVMWAGLRGETGMLKEVARVVEDSMAGLGFPREGRKFSPHLTLARIKPSRHTEELVRLADNESPRQAKLGIFRVASVELMQSDLTPRGPVYTLLAAVKIGN